MGALTLVDELTLLTYDERGHNTLVVGSMGNACLAGAALIELRWRGRLAVTAPAVGVADPAPTGDTLLDHVLMTVAAGPASRPAAEWTRLSRPHLADLRDRSRDALLARGVLRSVRGRQLLLFPAARYLPSDPGLRAGLKNRVRAAALEPGEADVCTSVLLVLLEACYLASRLFTNEQMRPGKERIETLRQEFTTASAADVGLRLILQGVFAAKNSHEGEGHAF